MKDNKIKNRQAGKISDEKLGLALSGGGFRASFFHIGVLAQMAMLGILRHVQVISTVSGGSIIGALYYLHVKKLLEGEEDGKIVDEDYINIIKKVEEDFFEAVQRNIRWRTFCNPIKNIKMSKANYSRSDRLGELYDKYFYRNVIDASRKKMIEMRELKIQIDGKDISPRIENKSRSAKVPILLLNATTLNTGHNWRFEASRMGEPPREDALARDIDKNCRLQQSWSYKEIIKKQQNIELGLAVAASACVPGLFHPLAISDLYPDDIRVQLVDGGVHDNQGIQGLLDNDCTMFIVSDASGQMNDESEPSTGIAQVVLRSNSILMARVREEQIFRLYEKIGKEKIILMHLQKGIEAEAKPWIGADGLPAGKIEKERHPEISSIDFGTNKSVQTALSKIRTDLDSFTEVEAYSLMSNGYNMCKKLTLAKNKFIKLSERTNRSESVKWKFLTIVPWMVNPNLSYKKHIITAGDRFFKVFKLSNWIGIGTIILFVCIITVSGIVFRHEIINLFSASLSAAPLIFCLLIILFALLPRVFKTLKLPHIILSIVEFPVNLIIRGIIPALCSIFVLLHLLTFDRLFKRLGRIKKLKPVD